LRGRSSDADERLVARTAKQLGLPLVSERADVGQFASAHKLSIEMAARKVRHDFLARAASQRRIPSVALAHHADDQLELFFLRLLRGSGGEGLAGMKWRNPSPSSPKIELIRPLLDQPKSALKSFAAEMKIPFREDATNALLEIQRNRIRHELLPLLREKYQPALDKSVPRLMEIIGAEAECVTEIAMDWLHRARNRSTRDSQLLSPFKGLPRAVQRRCLQLQLLRLGVAADFDLVEQLRLNADKPASVGNERNADAPGSPLRRVATRDKNGIVHLRAMESPQFKPEMVEIDLDRGAGEVVFAGVRVHWRVLTTCGNSMPRREAGREFFDAKEVGTRILLRHCQPGDRFQPIGMAAPVKLQNILTNEKILRNQRHELILGSTVEGEVFWVEGLRISERFKLNNSTSCRLQWHWKRL
jgi:tRNA(Ile)-lysidine synthase